MGSKVNPNIFQAGKTKTWNSVYIEKKTTEVAVYAFNDLEIQKFVNKFFHNWGLITYSCKIFCTEQSINVFVTYFLTAKSLYLFNKSIKKRNDNLLSKKIFSVKRRAKKKKKLFGLLRYFEYKHRVNAIDNLYCLQDRLRIRTLKNYIRVILIVIKKKNFFYEKRKSSGDKKFSEKKKPSTKFKHKVKLWVKYLKKFIKKFREKKKKIKNNKEYIKIKKETIQKWIINKNTKSKIKYLKKSTPAKKKSFANDNLLKNKNIIKKNIVSSKEVQSKTTREKIKEWLISKKLILKKKNSNLNKNTKNETKNLKKGTLAKKKSSVNLRLPINKKNVIFDALSVPYTKISNFDSIIKNSFLEKMTENISLFIKNVPNIFINLTQINDEVIKINKSQLDMLKQKIWELNWHSENTYFKESLQVIFLSLTKKHSTKFLAKFIASELQKQKRHHFFLNFLKQAIIVFNRLPFCEPKNITIKVKGRLNGAPKRKSRTIIIGEDIPMISLKSKVEYAEEICFTTNGTLSVKIWIAKRKTTGNLCKMVQKS
jgi:hypothetical protein